MKLRNILIVAATHTEIRPLLNELKVQDLPVGKVRSFQWQQLPLDILITGPGMVSTAFYMGRVRGLHEYSLVINAGIAGSFNKKITIGQCVNVISDCFADLGSSQSPAFVPLYSMPMAEDYILPGFDTENKIQNTNIPILSSLDSVSRAYGITVNTLTGKAHKHTGKPDVETMEGAAFLLVCKNAGVQCLQLRSISNFVTAKKEEPWDIPAAVSSLNALLLEIIHEL